MIKRFILNFSLCLFVILILALTLRGVLGTPTSGNLTDPKWNEDGPVELSPERGRVALALSILENHSFEFSPSIAKFTTPDLGFRNGKLVSLFPPLLSFIIIPGYVIGKIFDAGQLGMYAIVALLAFFNVILIKKISQSLGASFLASWIAGLVFLFATPAFAYSVSLYQHHGTTFLLLLPIYILISKKNNLWNFAVWFLIGLGLSLDYPNFFLMIPIGIASMKSLLKITRMGEKIQFQLKPWKAIAVVGITIPLLFFLWFNKESYGSPFTLGSSVEQIKELNPDGTLIKETSKTKDGNTNYTQTAENQSPFSFFNPRRSLEGLTILFLSPDRGLITFAPIMFIGAYGFIILYKKNNPHFPLLCAIAGLVVILYSMWGDTAGGWAFGSRYLIPAYAISSIFIAISLTYYNKNIIFIILFSLITAYSIGVNTLGALSSNRNPPLSEIASLEKVSGIHQAYSYDRALEFIDAGRSKSFVWQTYLSPFLNAYQYYEIIGLEIVGVLNIMLLVNAFYTYRNKKSEKTTFSKLNYLDTWFVKSS